MVPGIEADVDRVVSFEATSSETGSSLGSTSSIVELEVSLEAIGSSSSSVASVVVVVEVVFLAFEVAFVDEAAAFC